MVSPRTAWQCCLYSLSKRKSNPMLLAMLIVLLVYLDSILSPIRAFLSAYQVPINGVGLYPYLLADREFVMFCGIALLMLFSDCPFMDEAQQSVILRSGQLNWIWGQIGYILLGCLLLLAGIFLLVCAFLLPYVELSAQWGKAMNTLIQTNTASRFYLMTEFFSPIQQAFQPLPALFAGLALRWACFSACVLLMFFVNLITRSKAGALAALPILIMDYVVDVTMPKRYSILSPSTLARLDILAMGESAYYPDALAGVAVVAMFFLLSLCLVLLAHKRRDMTDMMIRD